MNILQNFRLALLLGFHLKHPTQPRREPIHITITASVVGIDLVIKILHRLGFAEWSKLQNAPNTGRPMRVLTK